MYDVVIIGAGVIGGMIARTLSEYKLKILILEKENDVSMGATKANSGIVHAGFDAKPGSVKAELNVLGSKMMKKTAEELGVRYINNGSLVIGFNEEDKKSIEELKTRGDKNGVAGLRILNEKELKELEPNISDNAVCGLYAPTGAIICPYSLAIAAIGNAMDNGAELRCSFKVTRIMKKDGFFEVSSEECSVKTRYIVNAAGVYADEIAGMAGDFSFKITPRRGEYILLDKECGNLVSNTIFRTPSKMGKGILISPTADGNLLTGPTAENITDKDDTSTTKAGFEKIIKESAENVKDILYNKSITSFSGLRASSDKGDFIINSPIEGFVNAAGIESPGLSASPAIALKIKELLEEQGLHMVKKDDFNPIRESAHSFYDASMEEKQEMIKKDSSYGRIICRCEGITEGEIRNAIRTNPKPTDLDGVKRRTRAQMGRCQGGFCMPYIMRLLSEESGVPFEKITKSGGKSEVVFQKTKEEI